MLNITPNDLERARKDAGFPTQASAALWLDVGKRTYERWVTEGIRIPKAAILALQLKKETEELKKKMIEKN